MVGQKREAEMLQIAQRPISSGLQAADVLRVHGLCSTRNGKSGVVRPRLPTVQVWQHRVLGPPCRSQRHVGPQYGGLPASQNRIWQTAGCVPRYRRWTDHVPSVSSAPDQRTWQGLSNIPRRFCSSLDAVFRRCARCSGGGFQRFRHAGGLGIQAGALCRPLFWYICTCMDASVPEKLRREDDLLRSGVFPAAEGAGRGP
mmetsp:Transcript_61077/g.109989  ORF Transcript_61077/g.109989 Transcript_61077/m.109989 type:complete len:200 (-) Transcript_61077:426-1025(-)